MEEGLTLSFSCTGDNGQVRIDVGYIPVAEA